LTKEEVADSGLGSYSHIKELSDGPYKGKYAHLAQMIFTVGIMVTDPKDGNPITRWCYDSFVEAKISLEKWNGVGSPPGNWIKQKPQNISRIQDVRMEETSLRR